MKICAVFVACLALSACSVFEGKQTVAERQGDVKSPRAYTKEIDASGEKKWVRIDSQPTTIAINATTSASTPADLANIEPAAGPTSAPTRSPTAEAARLGYTPGAGYQRNN